MVAIIVLTDIWFFKRHLYRKQILIEFICRCLIEFVTSPCKAQRILRTITESSKSTPVHGDCKFIANRGFGKG